MNLELKCNFKAKGQAKDFGQNKLQKFYVDIEKESKYPSVAEFQIWNDKINISDLKEGDLLNISFNISGRKWEKEGRTGFAQSLNVWKLNKESEQPAEVEQQDIKSESENEVLPF